MLEAVLAADGHTTGVCMKPHLHCFRERIRIDGRPVSNPELAEHTERVFAELREFVRMRGPQFHPSLFEALLLVAASIFRRHGVTIAVFEAGVGGFNDATSLLPAHLSVVTSVDLDHQDELGNTIEEIARDKAGIAASGSVLVLGAGLSASVRSVIEAEAACREVRCVRADADAIEVISESVDGQTICFSNGRDRHSVSVHFTGHHQTLNFATVWSVTRTLHELHHIENVDAILGVQQARLPGHFELIRGSPSWLLDVAHNTASIAALINTVSQHFCKDQIVLIVGATERHPWQAFVKLLSDWGVPILFCEGFSKSIPVKILSRVVAPLDQVIGHLPTPAAAVDHCLATDHLANKTVIVTGSLFLVGHCRHELQLRGLLTKKDD